MKWPIPAVEVTQMLIHKAVAELGLNVTASVPLKQAWDTKSNFLIHRLTDAEQVRLKGAIALFPSFPFEGLGQTNSLEYAIDVQNQTKTIKQRHYPISKAKDSRKVNAVTSSGALLQTGSTAHGPFHLQLGSEGYFLANCFKGKIKTIYSVHIF